MKFWQKTFMILLLVFIVTIDLCAILMMHFTYGQEMENMKRKGSSEAYFIDTSISNDLYSRGSSGSIEEETRNKVFENYLSYYGKQGILLGFCKGDQYLYGNMIEELMSSQKKVEAGSQFVYMASSKDQKYLCVACKLLEPYEEYTMFYAYSLAELQRGHERLLWMTTGMMIVITVILAVLLSMILKHLTSPLKRLEERALAIGKGDYEGRIEVQGQDEFASLSQRFNEMSGKIEEQVEALKEQDRKKQLLIDNMAHEFRTPLTSISGYASYLKMAVTSEDERLEALNYIISETGRLQRLSQIILRSAEIREEAQSFEKVEVSKLFERVKDSIVTYAQSKGANVYFHTAVDYIEGNAALLESLLINLVENALRACEEEKGEVRILVKEEKGKNSICIIDNGIGMEKDELSKITEPFYRIDKARSRKAGGVGLGVSFCKQIVSIHKGTLVYTSEKGKGTTVTVSLFVESL